ncbi:MAG: hypothetical protein FIA91_02320 [Geobacter sp.]|nr:hypothetical protein [Geobacter sp.]
MANPLRKTGLFLAEVDEQTLIYDATNNRTHCLNPQALKVWQLCNGLNNRNDMVLALKTAGHDFAMQPGDAEELVDAALDRFTELELLETGTLMTRRELGKVAVKALAAGLVLSVMMPTRAMAASGSESCDSLNEDECISDPSCMWVGICINNI